MSKIFKCNAYGIQIAESPSKLFYINLVNGDVEEVGEMTPTGTYNAIGYNTNDHVVYGWEYDSKQLVKIYADAKAERLPVIEELPAVEFNVGYVHQGYVFLYERLNTKYYVVDIDATRATYLKLVDPTNNYQSQSENYGKDIPPLSIADWVYDSRDNCLYSVTNYTGQMVKINVITNEVYDIPTTGLPSSGFGAIFTDDQNHIYALDNTSGDVYKISITEKEAIATLFSYATASSNNDGTRCPFAPVHIVNVQKAIDTTEAYINDVVTHTVTVTNQSNAIPITDVQLIDISTDGEYVEGSLTVDDVVITGNPKEGVLLDTVPKETTITITYQTLITCVPTPNPVESFSQVSYAEGTTLTSNIVTVEVLAGRGISFM